MASKNQSISSDMQKLLAHQNDIKKLLNEVDSRIFSLETQYLDDTPNGNIVKGWDIEARGAGNLHAGVRKIDAKDRIFSNSSYKFFVESNIIEEPMEEVPIKIDRRRKENWNYSNR